MNRPLLAIYLIATQKSVKAFIAGEHKKSPRKGFFMAAPARRANSIGRLDAPDHLVTARVVALEHVDEGNRALVQAQTVAGYRACILVA